MLYAPQNCKSVKSGLTVHLTIPPYVSQAPGDCIVPSERHSNHDIINDPISVWVWQSWSSPSHLHQTLNYFLLSLHFQIHHPYKDRTFANRNPLLSHTSKYSSERKLGFTLGPVCLLGGSAVVKLDLKPPSHLHNCNKIK